MNEILAGERTVWVAPAGHANCSAQFALICLSAWVSTCTHASPNYISGFFMKLKKNLESGFCPKNTKNKVCVAVYTYSLKQSCCEIVF